MARKAGSLLMKCSIVFVHGLNPLSKPNFAEATWTHGKGNFWPRQQLANEIPSARTHIFSYNSKVAWDCSINGIEQHAANLLDRLLGARSKRKATVGLQMATNTHSRLGG